MDSGAARKFPGPIAHKDGATDAYTASRLIPVTRAAWRGSILSATQFA